MGLNKIFPFFQKWLDKAFFNVCEQGDLSRVEALLKRGADVNTKKDDMSAMMCAIMNRHSDVAMLLARNPNIDINAETSKGETVLYEAMVQGDTSLVKSILSREDVDVSKKPYSDSTSLLHMAVLNEDYAMVHLLGRYPKTDVNAQDEFGKTPLHYAAKMKSDDIFRFLLFHPKTDVNVQDNEGKTPLYETSEKGKHIYAHYFLLHPDISPNIQDREGNTPLHIATLLGHEDTVQVLGLSSKVDLSVQNNMGRTAEQSTPFYETRKNFLLIKRLKKAQNSSLLKNTFFQKQMQKKQVIRN